MAAIDFKGQSAIVTGAGGGMGRQIALTLAARGAQVVVNDYGGDWHGRPGTSERADVVAREITTAGGTAIANADAVGTAETATAIVNAAMKAFGRIDILINNAGVSAIAPLDEVSDEDLERVVRVNYWGPYMLMRKVWPIMKRQSYGRILNVMSSAVLGIGAHAPYSSSKSGLIGLTTDAAIEGAAHGIKVNGTFPAGYSRLVEQSVEPHRRWMEKYFQPEKVAQAVAFLVSREMPATGEIYGVGAGRVSRFAIFNNEGWFDPAITPESVAAHFDQARDLSNATVVTSCVEEGTRYQRWCPWTGGALGIHDEKAGSRT